MERAKAEQIFVEMIENTSLQRHCRSVSMVMEAYAKKYGEDENQWAIAGLLHDADYEKYPEEHPNIIVKMLEEEGEKELAHAISAHYTKWGVPYISRLDKALLACDELTGFIVACALIRPQRMEGLKVKSVKKKFKNPKFAAGVERDEVLKGVELLEVDFGEHIQFIIDVLYENRAALDLEGES